MADNVTLQTNIEFDVDTASVRRAEAAFDSVRQEAADVEKAVKGASDSTAALASSASKLNTASVAAATERFDEVSQNVGLLGDFDSAMATLGGTIGGTTGELLNAVASFGAVGEAVPRLVASIGGLPATIGAAVQSIGVGGIGLIGALAALGIAATIAADQVAQANAQLEAFGAAREDVVRAIARGIPLEEAQARVAELEATLKEEQAALLENQRLRDESFALLQDSVGDFFARVLTMFGYGTGFSERANELQKVVDETNQTIQQYERAIDEGRFATEQTADAMQDVAQAATVAAQSATVAARAESQLASARMNTASASGMAGGRSGINTPYRVPFDFSDYTGAFSVSLGRRASGTTVINNVSVPLEAMAIQPAATTNAVRIADALAASVRNVR